jgi:aspartyl protease family protein
MLRNILLCGVSALCLAGLASKYAETFGIVPVEANHAVPAAKTIGDAMVAVPRASNGHFQVDAVIGGHQIPFMVDTGASLIVLKSEDAERLGIEPSSRDRMVRMQTANGVVEARRVRLAAVDIGPLTVQDVEAVVMPSGRLGQNLLGMSFLSRLRRFEFRTGELVLEQ